MIETQNLGKFFCLSKKKRKVIGSKVDNLLWAVKDVSFTIDKGEIVGLLGPNGAGKTTLLRVLAGSLRPSIGTAIINGVDVVEHPLEVHRYLGFLSGQKGLYDRLTAREMIEYYGRLHGLNDCKLKKRLDEIIDIVGMGEFIDRRNSELSSGMRQKVSIGRAIVHAPPILFMDEPTTGLDILASEKILQFVESYRDQGNTVVFATHHVHEIERLCDRILVLNNGSLCFNGVLEQILLQTGQCSLDKALLEMMF